MGTLVGAGQQQKRFPQFCADGTLTTGGTPQLILPQHQSRSYLEIQNLSSANLVFEQGSARATCAITLAANCTYGSITSITVTNAGFNFTKPPVVRFFGGGMAGNGSFLGLNQPGGEGPNSTLHVSDSVNPIHPHDAKAHCVMASASPNPGLLVSSIAIDDPGMGYVIAPYVFLFNSDLDPYGCALPSATGSLILPTATAPYILNGTSCHTDPVAVYGATTGQAFRCRWMP